MKKNIKNFINRIFKNHLEILSNCGQLTTTGLCIIVGLITWIYEKLCEVKRNEKKHKKHYKRNNKRLL